MATMQEIIKKYNLENLGGNDNFINDKFEPENGQLLLYKSRKF